MITIVCISKYYDANLKSMRLYFIDFKCKNNM